MSIQGSINQAIGSAGQAAAVVSGLNKLDKSIEQASPKAQLDIAAKAREQERQENIARSQENLKRHTAASENVDEIREIFKDKKFSDELEENLLAQKAMATQRIYEESQNLFDLDPDRLTNIGAVLKNRQNMLEAQNKLQAFYDKAKAKEAIKKAETEMQTKADLKKQTKSFIATNWNKWGQTDAPDPSRKIEV